MVGSIASSAGSMLKWVSSFLEAPLNSIVTLPDGRWNYLLDAL